MMDAQTSPMTDFVLLLADWPAAQGLGVIQGASTDAVIVERRRPAPDGPDAPTVDYYLMFPSHAAVLLGDAPSGTTIGQALDRGEVPAVPAREGLDQAVHGPYVVLDEGHVVGFANLVARRVLSFDGGRHRGIDAIAFTAGDGGVALPGVPTGADDPAAADVAVERSLQASFPETVPLQQSATLTLELVSGSVLGTALPIRQAAGTVLDILVQARKGFAVEGRAEGTLTVSGADDALPIAFKLRATAIGPGSIRVLAFKDGIALGALTLTPTVLPEEAGEAPGPAVSRDVVLAPVSVRLPDLSLLIEDVTVDGLRGFVMRISAADPGANLNLAKYGPVTFESDPGRYFEAFYKDVESLPLATDTDRANAMLKLSSTGTALFERLVPEEARRRLWELKDSIKTVLVQSEEPWVPWELCKLSGEVNGDFVDGPFLCEAFAITRWRPGLGLKPVLTLDNLAVVVPADSNLAAASVELTYLTGLAGAKRHVTRIPATPLDVVNALRTGQYDGWHFTGHGAARGSDPDQAAIYLEGRLAFTPPNISGSVRNLGKARPVVFLNACQVGRSDLTLTDIGGWAQRFLDAGAGAFIGAYWAVYDQPASAFAEALYDRLLAGVPLGEATLQARLSIKSDGDPTWLAYTVFGDPTATVRPAP